MLKQIAWNTFKNTGNINTMLELIEVDKAIKSEEIKKENSLEQSFLDKKIEKKNYNLNA